MGCAGVVQKGLSHVERTSVTVKVNVNVAACLFGIAAILHVFW